MFDPSKFTVHKAKPLPVMLLLDTSGSMSGEKIANLNKAVHTMIDTFAKLEGIETEILVSIITFGPVNLYLPFTSASQIMWHDLDITGDTPIGEAISKAKEMIENKEIVPSRSYRPTVVLISDGHPTDSWQSQMNDFISNGRSAKCDRMAMAIGYDADEEMLSSFIKGTRNSLFRAENASNIQDFFKFVTMSVTNTVSKAGTPINATANFSDDDI